MAKILLNVDLKTKEAIDSVNKLKGSIEVLAKSFEGVKVNKDLTAQIQSLTKYYKELTTAASKVSAASAKIEQDDLKAAKAKQQLAEATSKATIATEKAKQATEKSNQEAAKALIQEQKLEQQALKTAAAIEKAAESDEEEEKKLYGLEKAYAALLVKIQNTAEKVPTASSELGKLGDEAKEAWEEIRAFNNDEGALSSSTAELKENYDRLSAAVASYVAEQKEASQEILSSQKGMEEWTKSIDTAEKQAQTLETQLYNLLKRISNEENRYDNGVFDGLKDKIRGVIEETETLDKTDANYVTRVKELQKETAGVVGELAKVEATASHAAPAVATLGEKFGNLIERYAKFYASSLLVRKPLEMIKSALDDVGETLVKTEDAVIELQRVLDGTIPQSKEISDALYDLAYKYGQTFENASTIAANFARSGRTWNESIEATEAALMALNVAELNATEASDGLLSIIQQFGLETSDLTNVVDSLNKVADKNPVTTGKLLEAIKRSGSAAKNANISFEQTLAIITSISEATNRSGQNIGTAVNSLIQYSQKGLKAFESLSNKSAEVVARYRQGLASIVDVWKQVAEDIHNDKSMRDALIESMGTDGVEELTSSLNDELGDLMTKINNTYDVANTYRKNYFIALLDNMFDTESELGRYSKVLVDLQDVQGYSLKENERYMETYTAKVNQLKDAWQKLANDEQGFLALKKGLVEMGLSVVEFINGMGGLTTSLKNIAAITTSVWALFNTKKITDFFSQLHSSLVGTKENIASLLHSMTSIGDKITELSQAKKLYKEQSQLLANAIKTNASAEEILALKSDQAAAAELRAAAGASAWQAALGWIALIGVAISVAVTAIDNYAAAQAEAVEKAHDLRVETLGTWKEQKEHADKIEELLGELNDLNRDSEEYYKTEEKLVDLLGDKKLLLEGLTKGTEEYSEKVRELTEEERIHLEAQRLQAKQTALEELNYATGKYTTSKGNAGLSLSGKINSFIASSDGGFADVHEAVYEALKKIKAEADEVTKKYEKLYVTGGEISENLRLDYEFYQDVWREIGDEYEAYQAFLDEEEKRSKEAFLKPFENLKAKVSDALETLKEMYGVSDEFAKDKLATAIEKLKLYENALTTVSKANKEFSENGAVSASTMESLLKLGDDWVAALFDENEQLNFTSDAVKRLTEKYAEELREYGILVPGIEEVTEARKEEVEVINSGFGTKDAAIRKTEKEIERGKEFKTAIETVNAAQKELDATGKLSIETQEKLLGLRGSLVRAMINEDGEIDVNSEQVKKLIGWWKDYCDQLGIVIEDTYEVGKVTDETLDKIRDLISLRESELSVAEKDGSSLDTRAKLMRDIQDQLRLEIDHLTALGAEQTEINKLTAEWYSWGEKIDKMYDEAAKEQAKLIEEQQKAAEKAAKEAEQAEKDRLKAIEDAQKAQIASYDAEINLYNSKISLSEAENGTVEERVGYYEQIKEILQEKIEYLETLGDREAEINELKVDQYEIEEKIAKLKEDEIERQQQEELAVITDEIALLESRLKIAEQTYGAETERISILVSINALLADQIQYLISIGATELEINKIKSEQLSIQAQILSLEQAALNLVADEQLGAIQNELDALVNGIELEEKSLDLTEQQVDLEEDRSELLKKTAQREEEIAKAKLDYINSVIDAYKKSEDSADTLADKQAAVQAAREKLEQARRNAVGKAMEAAFKKQRDANSDALDLEEKRLAVEKARVALQAAEADRSVRVYNEESGEWERQADAKKVQDAKEAFNDAVRALNDFVEEQAWDEVIAAVENGSISGSRMNAILDKWAAENYGEGSPEFIAQIRQVYKQSLGHVDEDDSVIGAEKNVETAVKNLNEYLKDEAIKELKTYLATGARDQDEMRAILDKWMGLGEGTELYAWRAGLLDVVTEAIESGYYDDSKVRTSIEDVSSSVKSTTAAVHGTTTAVQNLEKTFVSEIQKAAKQSSEAIALVMEKYEGSVDPRLMEWAQQVLDKKTEYEEYDAYTHEKTANGMTQALIDQYMEEMKANSKEWQTADDERREWLENRNLFLGNSLGWERDKNSGVWYDSDGKRAYDNGGVLRGLGGIKATERPEIVLDPDLTEKILRPNSEAQFRAFADALGLIFEHGDRIGASSKPIFNGQRYSDSHNVSTVINGVPIPSHVAENYTIAELARMIPAV